MITPELRDLLASAGVVDQRQDPASITVEERLTLEKFDGDSGPLVERIVIEPDGSISEHWRKDGSH